MATATTKATSLTTLVIGQVEVPVGLFSTVASPDKLAEFETAGPTGGRLKYETRAVEKPPEPVSDPLGDLEGALERSLEQVRDPEMPPKGGPPLPEREPEAFTVGWESIGERDRFEDDPPPESARWRDQPGAMAEQQAIAEAAEKAGVVEPGALTDRFQPERPLGREDVAEVAQSAGEAHRGHAVHDAIADSLADGEFRQVLVEEGTGHVVEKADVRRGVRRDGEFIDCTDQLAQIDEDTRLDRMEVVPHGFVDITRVQRARMKKTYYLGAETQRAAKALRLIYLGLKRKRRGAVVKLTKKSRQSLGVVGWLGECLVLYELVFAEDFREPPARALLIQHEKVAEKVSDREVEAFCALIDAWSGTVAVLDDLRDDAIARREELYAQAVAGEVQPVVALAADDTDREVLAQLEATIAAVA